MPRSNSSWASEAERNAMDYVTAHKLGAGNVIDFASFLCPARNLRMVGVVFFRVASNIRSLFAAATGQDEGHMHMIIIKRGEWGCGHRRRNGTSHDGDRGLYRMCSILIVVKVPRGRASGANSTLCFRWSLKNSPGDVAPGLSGPSSNRSTVVSM